MLTAVTGHHRAGASRVPRQAWQNIWPGPCSLPHHLHGRAGNTLFNIPFACSLAHAMPHCSNAAWIAAARPFPVRRRNAPSLPGCASSCPGTACRGLATGHQQNKNPSTGSAAGGPACYSIPAVGAARPRRLPLAGQEPWGVSIRCCMKAYHTPLLLSKRGSGEGARSACLARQAMLEWATVMLAIARPRAEQLGPRRPSPSTLAGRRCNRPAASISQGIST